MGTDTTVAEKFDATVIFAASRSMSFKETMAYSNMSHALLQGDLDVHSSQPSLLLHRLEVEPAHPTQQAG